jgi:uncharacterized protein YjiS (DUF1127 family)
MSAIHSLVVDVVGDLHREYGFWRVARALVASALKERRKRNDLRHFSDRMLRDIGVSDGDPRLREGLERQPMIYWLGFRP